jgi:hypothetical protein
MCAGDGEELYGVPFAVDVGHAVGRESGVPDRWEEALQGGAFALPLGGTAIQQAAGFLSLFASAGGDPASFGGPDTTGDGPLQETVDFLEAAREADLWSAAAPAATPQDAWVQFLSGDAQWAAISGTVFLPQQASFPGFVWDALPGATQPAPPIAWGWCLVAPRGAAGVVHPNTVTLIDWLTEPGARDWVSRGGQLPAWPPEGSDDWVAPGSAARPSQAYVAFLQDMLSNAVGVDTPEPWAAAVAAAMTVALSNASSP